MDNYNAFHVTYHGPTNHKPSRIKIKSLRFKEYIWISRGEADRWEEEAADQLRKLGFNMIGLSEYPGNGFILFSDTFKPLKQ